MRTFSSRPCRSSQNVKESRKLAVDASHRVSPWLLTEFTYKWLEALWLSYWCRDFTISQRKMPAMTAKMEPVTSRLAHPLKKLLQTLLGAYLFHHSPPSCKQTRKPGVGDQDLLVRCLYISLDFQETDFLSSVCLDWLCLFSEWTLFHKKNSMNRDWVHRTFTYHVICLNCTLLR